jgi:hypothetical protein
MLSNGNLDKLAHLRPAQLPLGKGVVDQRQVLERLAGRQELPCFAPAHPEAGHPVARGALEARELVQPARVDLLEVEGDHAVPQPRRRVGRPDPLLDLREGQALFEDKGLRNVLLGGCESAHDILSVGGTSGIATRA